MACAGHSVWVVSLQYFQEKLSCFDRIDLPVALTSEEARPVLGEEVPRSQTSSLHTSTESYLCSFHTGVP